MAKKKRKKSDSIMRMVVFGIGLYLFTREKHIPGPGDILDGEAALPDRSSPQKRIGRRLLLSAHVK